LPPEFFDVEAFDKFEFGDVEDVEVEAFEGVFFEFFYFFLEGEGVEFADGFRDEQGVHELILGTFIISSQPLRKPADAA
jgi:hypothetical protein